MCRQRVLVAVSVLEDTALWVRSPFHPKAPGGAEQFLRLPQLPAPWQLADRISCRIPWTLLLATAFGAKTLWCLNHAAKEQTMCFGRPSPHMDWISTRAFGTVQQLQSTSLANNVMPKLLSKAYRRVMR